MTPDVNRVGWSVPRGTVLETLTATLTTVYDARVGDHLTYEIGAACDACHQLLGVPDRTQLRVWAKRQQRPMTAPLGAEGVGSYTPVPDVTPGRQIGGYLQDASVTEWLWLHPRHRWLLDERAESSVNPQPDRS